VDGLIGGEIAGAVGDAPIEALLGTGENFHLSLAAMEPKDDWRSPPSNTHYQWGEYVPLKFNVIRSCLISFP
jgi:hypothetical protein